MSHLLVPGSGLQDAPPGLQLKMAKDMGTE